jgi:hypothetical protein
VSRFFESVFHGQPLRKELARTKSNGTRRGLRFEVLEPRVLLAGDTYLINFQLDSAPIPTRYEPDIGEVFGDRGNGLSYGWSSDHTDLSREREANADQRLDTLVDVHLVQTWELELPNGSYEVTAAIGDAIVGSKYTLNIEDVNFWDVATLPGGQFLVHTLVGENDYELHVRFAKMSAR